MAVYDLEEQDKLDDLKAWWSQWGNTIAGVVIAVCVGVIGVQGWRWWSMQQAEQASVLYNAVSAAARANDTAKAKDAMAQLADKFGGTGYAPRAALIVAALLFENGDKAGAKAQLASVIDRNAEDELKQIARLRLAAILFDDKQYDEALRTLDAKHDESFAGIYADLRGDILAAAGRADDARAAYQTALTRLDAKSPYRNFVQVEARHPRRSGRRKGRCGGPPAPAAAASAASCRRSCRRSCRALLPPLLPPIRRNEPDEPVAVSRAHGLRLVALCAATLVAAGCSTLSSWIPTIPPPSFAWFSSSKKPGPLPEFKPAANLQVAWQVNLGKANPGSRARGDGGRHLRG